MEKTIYELGLHESVTKNSYYITRVVGGWIYCLTGHSSKTAVFVPFHNEFMESVKSDYKGETTPK